MKERKVNKEEISDAITYLSALLKFAEENPEYIGKEKEILHYGFQKSKKFYVKIRLDKEGKLFADVNGEFHRQDKSGLLALAEEIIEKGKQYLPKSLDEFVQELGFL